MPSGVLKIAASIGPMLQSWLGLRSELSDFRSLGITTSGATNANSAAALNAARFINVDFYLVSDVTYISNVKSRNLPSV